ncbi:MAG: DUF6476 family protein [Geminicoccaceae bacterium]
MDNISSLLKAFVIAGGIALVAGTILLVVLIVMRAGERQPIVQQAPQILRLPAGARIEQVVVDGRRLVLLGRDGAGMQFLAVVDPVTGERLSLLRVQPEEAAQPQ